MKKKAKSKSKKKALLPDLGDREFLCKNCGAEFSIGRETIFAIQETTHGYVGYEFGDYYIECPKCGHSVEDDEDPHYPL